MPIFSSFTEMASPRPPMPPVTSAIRFAILLSSLLWVLRPLFHVSSRSGLDRFVLRVSEPSARGDAFAAVRLGPFRPCGPPAARMLGRLVEPGLRIGPHLRALRTVRGTDPVAALVARRGVDRAGDVAGGAEDEVH